MTQPSSFTKLTPSLLVDDVERSLTFYVEVLGFSRGMTVPDAPPFVFGSVTSGAIEIFFNEKTVAAQEYPAFAGKLIGATATMFIEMQPGGVDAFYERLKAHVPVVMPLVTQWYGLKEFAMADPDGS